MGYLQEEEKKKSSIVKKTIHCTSSTKIPGEDQDNLCEATLCLNLLCTQSSEETKGITLTSIIFFCLQEGKNEIDLKVFHEGSWEAELPAEDGHEKEQEVCVKKSFNFYLVVKW